MTTDALARLGRYAVSAFLRRGPCGHEYVGRADDGHEDVLLVLPTLLDEGPEAAGARARFEARAHAVAALRHPAIARIREIAEDPATARPFLVADLVRGKPLSELISAGHPFTDSEAVGIVSAIADALHHAHTAGVVHGAITPACVVLDTAGTVRLTGFPLGTIDHSLSETGGGGVGGPCYLAPEQIKGQPAEPRTDLFALGVILFQLVTGTYPYGVGTPRAIRDRIVSEAPPLASTARKGVPQALNALIFRLMQRDVLRRPASAAETVRLLGNIQRSLLVGGVAVAKQGPVTRRAAATGRPRWLIPALAAAGVVVVIGAVLLWPRQRSAPGGFAVAAQPTAVAPGERLRAAESALGSGDVVATRRLLAEAEKLGASPAEVSAVRARLEEFAADQARPWIEHGTGMMRERRWEEAAAAFTRALALQPGNREAQLQLDEVRDRQVAEARAREAPATGGRATRAAPPRAAANLQVYFNSPLERGSFEASLDGRALEPRRFDFTGGDYLGLRRRGGGVVDVGWRLPEGSHAVVLRLLDGRGALLREETFQLRLAAGEGFQIRVGMRDASATPSFVLAPLRPSPD